MTVNLPKANTQDLEQGSILSKKPTKEKMTFLGLLFIVIKYITAFALTVVSIFTTIPFIKFLFNKIKEYIAQRRAGRKETYRSYQKIIANVEAEWLETQRLFAETSERDANYDVGLTNHTINDPAYFIYTFIKGSWSNLVIKKDTLINEEAFIMLISTWSSDDLSRISLEILQFKAKEKSFFKANKENDAIQILSALACSRIFKVKVLTVNTLPLRVKEYIAEEERQFKTFMHLLIAWSPEQWAAQGPLVLNFQDGIAQRLWLLCVPISLEERQKKLSEFLDPTSRLEALAWFRGYLADACFECNQILPLDQERLLALAGFEKLDEQILENSQEISIRKTLESTGKIIDEWKDPLTFEHIRLPVKVGPYLYEQGAILNSYLLKAEYPLTSKEVTFNSLKINIDVLQKQRQYLKKCQLAHAQETMLQSAVPENSIKQAPNIFLPSVVANVVKEEPASKEKTKEEIEKENKRTLLANAALNRKKF